MQVTCRSFEIDEDFDRGRTKLCWIRPVVHLRFDIMYFHTKDRLKMRFKAWPAFLRKQVFSSHFRATSALEDLI